MSNQNLVRIFAVACLMAGLSYPGYVCAQISAQPTTNRPSDLPTETRRPVSISGAVVLDDGSPLTEPVQVQRVCGNVVLGENDSDARGKFNIFIDDESSIGFQGASEGGGASTMGAQLGSRSSRTTRTQLWGCEIRALLPGYTAGSASLAGRDFSTPVTLANIVLHRIGGGAGPSISANDLQVPADARKEFEKGREDYFKKKYEDADKHLDKAVTIYPHYASALDLRGRAQRASRKNEEAEKSFLAAIEADEKFVAPYLHLAALCATSGKWPEVIAFSNKAIELDANTYTEPYYLKAVAQLMTKQVQQAKINISKVLEMDKEHRFPRAELMMGNILRSEGNDAAAAERLSNYLKIEPNSPDAAKIREYLASIQPEKSQPTPSKEQR
jgi:tetratricopeptide (TPR) repeat protein